MSNTVTPELSKKQIQTGLDWFEKIGWKVFPFQKECWRSYLEGWSGIVNAPTGTGKTYALFIPIALEFLCKNISGNSQIHAIWVCPIRALTKEIQSACIKAAKGLDLDWKIQIRSGDTPLKERRRMFESAPNLLITTPESLHVILATNGYSRLLGKVSCVIVDEWHELMGSKRGVQVELALSRLKGLNRDLKIWGISATISNLDQAMEVLLGPTGIGQKRKLIRSKIEKRIAVESVIPHQIEKYPWSGHLGIRMIDQLIPIVSKSKSCLIFTNTRSQCEIWYQKILDKMPEWAGIIAMHHGSISRSLREWVEEALHLEKLKAVVCTSSLDLGVDFRPVETIIQVGSPKGVSRFIQRAGRSGHQPNAVSKIYFVPTHSLELVEGAALRTAISSGVQEPRIPYLRSFDVLIQYLMTLAVSEGFNESQIFEEVIKTHCFQSITKEEWNWVLEFLVFGGPSLQAYNEYRRLIRVGNLFKVANKHLISRHKLSIGTIVGDASLNVKYTTGRRLGTIEEWFVSRLNEGDVFWFAGRPLEFVRIKNMDVYVRKSNRKSGKTPSWMGGRLPVINPGRSPPGQSYALPEIRICSANQNKNQQLDEIETMPEYLFS